MFFIIYIYILLIYFFFYFESFFIFLITRNIKQISKIKNQNKQI